MIDVLRREAVYLWYYVSILLEQIAPYYVLGMAVGSVISVFGKQRIHGLFAAMQHIRWGWFGVVPASLLGIASPLCMYGTIPIAASFSQKGMRDDWLTAFMMSSILLNPQLILYSAALGGVALTLRLVSCFFCGALAGVCVRLFYRDKPFFDFSGFAPAQNRKPDPNPALRLLGSMGRNLRATGPYFLLGIALSAAFQRYIPERWVTNLFGGNRGWGVLMAATIGVPLYACGGGTIPLLLDWMSRGMSLGGATAFMITGPATKITNLGALKIVLGFKRFCLYLLYALLFAFLTGLVVDLF